MKRSSRVGLVVAALVVAPGVAEAKKSTLREALGAVEDAIDRVKEEGGSCKKSMLSDLKDVKDDLRAQIDKPRDRGLAKLEKSLSSLEDDAGDCPKKVGKLLR